MNVLDVHSYFGSRHPLHQPGDTRYLLAPSIIARAPFDTFPEQMMALGGARAAGGLLPVHPLNELAFGEALANPWWKGLLLSPVYDPESRLTDAQLMRRIHHGRAQGMPLMVECGLEHYSRPAQLAHFLERLVPRPVILTHGGQLNISGSDLSAASKLFEEYPQTYLETSGIYRQDFLEEMVQLLGPERILYGSGHPWMDEALELERVRILPVAPEELEGMVGGNGSALFQLGAGSEVSRPHATSRRTRRDVY